MDIGNLIIALTYASGFWALSWRYPALALGLIFATAPFQNDLSAGLGPVKFSFAEINLVLTLPLFAVMLILNKRRLQVWPLFWTSLVYSVACLASSLVKWHSSALSSFVQMALFLFVVVPVFALLGRRPDDLKPALWGLLGIGTFLGLNVLATRSQSVFNINKNGLGGSFACALIVAVELWFHYREKPTRHKYVLLGAMGFIAMGLLLTLSRGGWIAALGGILLIVTLRRQFALMGRVAIVLIPVLAIGWSLVPQKSREYATGFGAERGNIQQRHLNTAQALKAWQTNVWFGDGLGLRKEMDATNFVVVGLGETGVVGLVTFMAMFVAFFGSLWRTRGHLPRDDFAFSLLCIGGGLMLSRLMQGMVDHYWARGPTMMAWAAAGMATGALWYRPEVATGQLQRARALLSLHLLETLRRKRNPDLALPQLTRTELEAAQSALAMVKNGRSINLHAPAASRGENDALSELANRIRTNGHQAP